MHTSHGKLLNAVQSWRVVVENKTIIDSAHEFGFDEMHVYVTRNFFWKRSLYFKYDI